MIKEYRYEAHDAWGGYSEYELKCDKCKKCIRWYHTFSDAVKGKKTEKVRSVKLSNGKWEDICLECQKGGDT